MDKRRMNWITLGFIGAALLVIALMMVNTLHRPAHLVLPDTTTSPEQSVESNGTDDGSLTVVQITPKTVQTAIATLERPENYRRTVKVEQFWTGGSGAYEVSVTASAPWIRTDRTMPDGRVRHSITGEDRVYIWYNNEREIYSAPAGAVSADNEQTIPTYEDVLALPMEEITTADYRVLSGVNCIYVEAVMEGGILRYWVDVETGLLAAAERLLDETVIYRMEALSADLSQMGAEEFTLPDGTKLIETNEDGAA